MLRLVFKGVLGYLLASSLCWLMPINILAADSAMPLADHIAINELSAVAQSKRVGLDSTLIDRDFFDHNLSSFVLRGSHVLQACSACHNSAEAINDVARDCVHCHSTEQAMHPSIGRQCGNCHIETIWAQTSFAHVTTGYQLVGAHQHVVCTSCHVNNVYKNTPKTCVGCHSLDNLHRGFNSLQCGNCHDSNAWRNQFFDHNRQTDFPLNGRHQTVTCRFCHVDVSSVGTYKPGLACQICHAAEAAHPSIFKQDCGSCHTAKSWKKNEFNHQSVSKFELRGKHKQVACVSCHQNTENPQSNMHRQCVACHIADDVHDSQLGDRCNACHNANAWLSNIHFDHDLAAFPLLGMHNIVSCEACHLTRKFRDTSSRCHACHASVKPADPDHLATACETCHSPVAWKIQLFNHSVSEFAKFDEQHFAQQCIDCHQLTSQQRFKNPVACAQCHREKKFELHR